jgi:hypothetical protein
MNICVIVMSVSLIILLTGMVCTDAFAGAGQKKQTGGIEECERQKSSAQSDRQVRMRKRSVKCALRA